MIKSFRDLKIYQSSLGLAGEMNGILNNFPRQEKFLLVDQMRRASRAIPSLISEGWAKRKQTKEFKKYLRDALGETNEMMNHLEQSRIFGYLQNEKATRLIEKYDQLGAGINKLKDNWQVY